MTGGRGWGGEVALNTTLQGPIPKEEGEGENNLEVYRSRGDHRNSKQFRAFTLSESITSWVKVKFLYNF